MLAIKWQKSSRLFAPTIKLHLGNHEVCFICWKPNRYTRWIIPSRNLRKNIYIKRHLGWIRLGPLVIIFN